MRSRDGKRWAWEWVVTALVLLFAPMARAAPELTLSPPTPVEVSPELVPVGASASDVATDGSKWFVVYAPYRDFGQATPVSIVGRLVDFAGAPIALPFQLQASAAAVVQLKVAFDGTSFVVVWEDRQRLPEGNGDSYSLKCLRVSPDGTTASEPTLLETLPGYLTFAVSGGETGAFVVRAANSGGRTWVVTDGAVVEGDAFDATLFTTPFVGFSDGVWLVASSEGNSSSQFVQFGGDGKVVPDTSQALAASAPTTLHSIAPAADGFVIARGVGETIELVRVGFDGTPVLDAQAIAPPDVELGAHSLNATADGYALVYQLKPTPCFGCSFWGMVQPLTSTLHLATAEPFVLQNGMSGIASSVAAGGSKVLVTWAGTYSAVRAALLTLGQEMAFGPDVPVSVAPAGQAVPRAAPGNDGWLVAWEERRITQDDTPPFMEAGIRAVRLDALGTPTSDPITVSNVVDRRLIDVSRGPGGWLVTGYDNALSSVVYVSDAMEMKGVAAPVSWGTNPSQLRVVGSPAGWLVVWQQDYLGVLSLEAARIGPAGTVVDSARLATTSSETLALEAGYQNGGYKVLWQDGNDISSVTVPTSGPYATPSKETFLTAHGVSQDFSVAFADNAWWAWLSFPDNSFHTSGGQEFNPPGTRLLPLVAVDGVALAGSWSGNTLYLALAEPDGPLASQSNIRGWDSGDLSEAMGNQVLLASVETEWFLGAPTKRIQTRFITVSGGQPPVTGMGGMGGVENGSGGAGNAAGSEAGAPQLPDSAGAGGIANDAGAPNQPPTGEAGAPNAVAGQGGQQSPTTPGGGGQQSPTTDGGAEQQSPTTDGGAATAANGGAPIGGGDVDLVNPTSPPRTARGCGCRTTGNANGPQQLAPSLLLLLAIVKRRRGRDAERRGAKDGEASVPADNAWA